MLLVDVVVTDEDPAYRIIREAIKRKRINKKGLKNFEYNAYSKKILKSSDEIALIEESFVKGYSKIPEWEKEFILKTHKTENQKKNVGSMDVSVSDKYLIDFSKDTLSLMMNQVYLPLADNAFDYYDYKLISTIESGSAPIYNIQVIPKSKIQPLLEGTIQLEGENYSICNVDLQANKGIRFPYVHDLILKFNQSLGKYDGYWLPDYVEMQVSLSLNLSGLIGIDKISYHMTNIISNYKINQTIPDSIEHARHSKYGGYRTDTSKNYKPPLELADSKISSLRPIPLTNSEVEAFATLDSTKTIEKMIKPTGLLSGLIPDEPEEKDTSGNSVFGKITSSVFNYGYLNINRVEEFTLGVNYKSDFLKNKINLKSYLAYSFGVKKPLGSIQVGYNLKDFFLTQINLGLFHSVNIWQNYQPYTNLINSAGVLLGFEDQFNYYLSSGFLFGVNKNLNKSISTSLNFISEKQSSLKENKYLSIFNRKRFVRVNPEINEGFDRRIQLSCLIGKSPYNLEIIPKNSLLISADLSDKKLNSDFNYLKINFAGQLRIKNFYKELFLYPYLLINIEGGYIKNDFGIQQIFSPVASLGFYSPATSFKGLKPYQFVGDKMIAMHVEENWRTIIFQALGLDFLTNSELDIVTGVSSVRIWNDTKFLNELTQQKPYWEAYIGISRILAILRLDFSYNSLKMFNARLSTAVVF